MPKLQIIGPADPVNLPNASPESFGAGVGRAMQETGRVGQALGQVLQQVIDSKAKSAAVQYEQELSAAANEISLDPDITKRGEKFEAAQRSLQERYRPKLGARGTFDSAAGMATMELRTKFDHKTMVDGIGEARRNTEINIGYKAMKAATAETDQEVATLFQEIQNDLTEGSLYLTPAQQTQMFQKSMGDSIRAMADTNPKRALQWIDRVGPMLGPEVTAVYRGEAITNIRQAAAAEVAEQEAAQKRIDLAEKMRSKAAGRELIQMEADGNLTVGAVRARIKSGELSEERGRLWLDRAKDQAGGGDGGSRENRQRYVELREASDRGEDISEASEAAYIAGEISKTDWDSLNDDRSDVVFKEPRKSILGTLDPKNFGASAARMNMPQLRSDAILAFDRWKRANPDASIEQAEDKAKALIDGALKSGNQTKAARNLAPLAGIQGRPIKTQEEVDKALRTLNERFQRGEISQTMFEQKLTELDEVSQSIEADALANGGE